tara:strand:- start:338 stop:601 length:264 start_codon:yes stop_codon:yes gene_type:complete
MKQEELYSPTSYVVEQAKKEILHFCVEQTKLNKSFARRNDALFFTGRRFRYHYHSLKEEQAEPAFLVAEEILKSEGLKVDKHGNFVW